MLTPRRQVLLLGFVLFLLLGALAVFASPLSAGNLEARLQRAAEEALYSVRAEDWASVEMDGQVATVTGLAPDRIAQARALEAVRHAAWAGGIVAGGITKVIDETRLEREDADFELRADLVGGRLTLTGFAPDAAGQARLNELAELRFPGRASLDVRLAPGGAPAGWESAARLMLGELARLDYGTGLMRGDRLVVTGISTNPQTVNSVRAALQQGPAGFVSTALVRTPGGSFHARIEDPALCRTAIDAALGPRPIAFSPGSASLTEPSRNMLRRAGDAFARCDTAPLVVSVRADPEEGGDPLALERAGAIITAMRAAGLAADRFEASVLPGEAHSAISFSIAAAELDTQDEVREDIGDAETEG